ncbi:universal stress protein [Bernardetia sp.]|uniref:universal stress protein n=1 Tax=Bernardetia sp. TaxID=1937974 RepID=UPI0025C34BB6|nr:universal stress protein [Bernardetia sp.]
MQTIFVPLDFSQNSLLALRHAIELAKESDAKIIIFHSYQPPQMGGGSFTGRKKLSELGKQEAEDNMYKVVMQTKEEHPNLDFEHLVVDGDPLQRVRYYSESYNADLIVMGTKGASGLTEVFLGSVAAKVISDASCPVVIVPEGSQEGTYERIVYGVSMLPEDEEVLDYLQGLASNFKASLEGIHVEKDAETSAWFDEFKASYDKKIAKKKLSENQFVNFQKLPLAPNQKVEDTLIEYINTNPLTLFVMLRRNRRNFWERIFGTSITKQMAFHANSPLLIMKAGNAG